MTCKPCVAKWTEYYKGKGFDTVEAERMAKKLVKRVEKRQAKDNSKVRKWVFKTNWRATLRWRRWIGKGNPVDYYQSCGGCTGGHVVCTEWFFPCGNDRDCISCTEQDWTCPNPLPHSHLESNNCLCWGPQTPSCVCDWDVCSGSAFPGPCTVAGRCGYHCDPGYYWDGQACVLSPPPSEKQSHGDAFHYVE